MRMDINKFWRVMLGSYSDNPTKYLRYYQQYCRYHREEEYVRPQGVYDGTGEPERATCQEA